MTLTGQLTARRIGTRLGDPMHRRPARERRRSRREDLIRLPIDSPSAPASLNSLSHVALFRGGFPSRCCCPLIAAKFKQETSCSEPTGLRPLQAQKESVPFPIPINGFYAHIYSPLLTALCRRSPLSVYFPFVVSRRTFTPCRSAGDGASSRPKCTNCSSSGSDCIFTESTKVGFLLLMSALLWLNTRFSLSQTRGPPKRYVARFVIGVPYLIISNLYP